MCNHVRTRDVAPGCRLTDESALAVTETWQQPAVIDKSDHAQRWPKVKYFGWRQRQAPNVIWRIVALGQNV